MEFPHLLNLIRHNQFDTIYHEHFSYLSLLAVGAFLPTTAWRCSTMQELPTHGGSLRIFAQHANGPHATQPGLQAVRDKEAADGLDELDIYARFAAQVDETKRALLRAIDAKEQGLRVAGYGAPAKGNTLLNYCGVRTDLIDFTVDASPHKQGTWLPGTRIPVYALEKLREAKPDIVLILPWNLRTKSSPHTAISANGAGALPCRFRAWVCGVTLSETPIAGAWLLEIQPVSDERGFLPAACAWTPWPRTAWKDACSSKACRSTSGAARCAACITKAPRTKKSSWCASPRAAFTM